MNAPLILLDFDGTIVDSLPSIVHATQRTFVERGLAAPEREDVRLALHDGRGLEFYLSRLAPGLSPEGPEMEDFITHWRDIYAREAHGLTRPFPGAREALESLHARGAILAVVSNKNEPALIEALARMGLNDLFAAVAGQIPDRPKKPDPAPFVRTIAPLVQNFDPGRVLMVGDSEADLLFGRAIGARACFAAYGYGDPKVCAALADTVADDVTGIPMP